MINTCLNTVIKTSIKSRVAAQRGSQLLTNDNISLNIDYFVAYEIIDPYSALIGLAQLDSAIGTIAAGKLKAIVSSLPFQSLLKSSLTINSSLKSALDADLSALGIQVTAAEISAIILSNELTLSMAQVAISERDGEAQYRLAQANLDASKFTNEAASILKENQNSMDLHFFETLKTIAQKWNETIITADGMLYIPKQK